MTAEHPAELKIARLDGLLREALCLTQAARAYLEGQAPRDRKAAAPLDRAAIACESMRLSLRLTQVLSWLMTRRAVLNGELSEAEARRPQQRLGLRAICTARSTVADQPLPPRLEALLGESRSLYLRAARLDALLDRQPSMPELHGSLARHAKAARRNKRQAG